MCVSEPDRDDFSPALVVVFAFDRRSRKTEAMLAPSMRPKFSADTYYIPLHDGVYLRSNTGGLILKGSSLYLLLAHLVPSLDGGVTLEEITQGLDAPKRKMLTDLVERLLVHRFLTDVSQDQPHALVPAELELYSSDLAFIGSFQTSAAHRFEVFRSKRLLIIGSGRSLTLLVRASLECGTKQIGVIRTPESDSGLSSPPGLLGLSTAYDPEQVVQGLDAPRWDDEADVIGTMQRYDIILHIAEQPMLARAQLLNRLCIEQRKTLSQAIVVNDHAWVGPLVSPGTGKCWECAWRRLEPSPIPLTEQFSHYEFRDQPALSTTQSLALPPFAMTANRLVFELFKYVTGAGRAETARDLIDIDLKTSLSEHHTFLPHPHCLACQHPVAPTASQFLEQVEQLRRQGPGDLDTFVENAASCVDNRLGLFTSINDDGFVQAPLAVYRVTLSTPVSDKRKDESLSVVTASTDRVGATTRALQRACECYAANLVDRRRLLLPEEVRRGRLPAVSMEQLVGTPPRVRDADLWAWGLDLLTQRAYLVPAACVYYPPHNEGHGVASGMEWEEALCIALLDWCRYLTIRQLGTRHRSYPEVDLNGTLISLEGRQLHALLNAAVGRIAVYDVTGTLQVPTFATCVAGRAISYSTHCDVAEALRMGLELTLQQCQSEQSHQPEYALAPVPDVPADLRSGRTQVSGGTPPGPWGDRLDWLLRRLQANSLRPLVIPLDHDAALMRILPYVVRVLLTRERREHGW